MSNKQLKAINIKTIASTEGVLGWEKFSLFYNYLLNCMA